MARREDEEDDFYASGNLTDEGHPKTMEVDLEAQEARRRRIAEAMAMSEQDIMLAGRKAMLIDLLMRIEDGTAMPADMANMRALLKDNGMIMGDPMRGPKEIEQNPKTAKEPLALPSFERPEYDEED
jgi:hypothetical protein